MRKLEMTDKDIDRAKVLEKVTSGQWTQKKAHETLRISLRQVKRLCKRYRSKGVEGLLHAGRGKTSARRMDEKTKKELITLMVREEFEGFGPTLLQETFEEEYGIKVGREWLRQQMMEAGKWRAKKTRKVRSHPRRKRRSRRGELIQLDGSYEDWFESRGPRCCLLVMIDDATSEIMAMRFVEHETTLDYFEIMKEYIVRFKLPLALYSDRHSVFKVSRSDASMMNIHHSQFERAMKELKIEVIHARSPQAKGRVERANGTLQDRLIKKMRRRNLSTMEEGNNFLEEHRKEHNQKFAKKAENSEDAHVEMLPSVRLDRILTLKEKRKISKNSSIQYQGTIYQLELKNNARRMQGKEIDVLERKDGGIIFEYNGRTIKYSIYEEIALKSKVIDYKELEVLSERKKPLTSIQKHRKRVACNF